MTTLSHPQYQAGRDRYSVRDLNAVVIALADNDESLRVTMEALQQIICATPGPTMTPAELEAAIDVVYGSGDTTARDYVVVPPDRSLQEITNLFAIEPFASLIAGTKLQPLAWLPILRLISMLKGMSYLVYDGPSYSADPEFVKDGSFFFSSVVNPSDDTQRLLMDGTGKPLVVGNGVVYRTLPLGRDIITLVEFILRRLEFTRLRQLHQISAFEAGIDNKYDSAAGYDLLANAFLADASPLTLTKRFPCGFTSPGDLLFLRTQAGRYRGNDLNVFRPDQAGGGVEERVIIDESMVQTPMGLFRLPRCVLRWDHLVNDSMRESDPATGDPAFFIGLQVSLSLIKRGSYANGVAVPSVVTDLGLGEGVVFLGQDDVAGPIPNYPSTLTGTQAAKRPLVTSQGHEQGRLIGFLQKDGADKFGQYAQVHLDVVMVPLHAKQLFNAAVNIPAGQIDEIGKIGELGTDADQAPWRTFGIGPRHALRTVAPFLPDFTLDVDQGILVQSVRSATEATQVVVLPVGIYLAKNGASFGIDNLNGCTTRFKNAFSIRQITSAQPSLNTVIFDDGTGNPEAFPQSFIGATLTIYHADGTSDTTTIIERVGDRLARVPPEVVAKVSPGDIATIDNQQPSQSLDGNYNREVGVTSFVDLRLVVRRMVDPVVTPSTDGILSPSPTPSVTPLPGSPDVPWTALQRNRNDGLVQAAMVPFTNLTAGIASKLRWNYAQRFAALASARQDLVDLSHGTTADLASFLLRYVQTYDANAIQDWVIGQNAIIHWPAKNPITRISLRRYSPPVLPGADDGLSVEDVPGWGPVPVLTKYLRADDNERYPLPFIESLAFRSDRSFTVPGHSKLSGSFSLQPQKTWIVQNTIVLTLYQTKVDAKGVSTQVVLGTVDLDWTRADSFSNATGVFRIDGGASYNPSTGQVLLNYNQVINFTAAEPGSLDVRYSYNDLSQIQPIYKIDIGLLGLDVSHLFEMVGFSVVAGAVTQMTQIIRLEGITLANGVMYVRPNREDSFAVIAARGAIRFKWVLRGIPFITIKNVTYDANGLPQSVDSASSQVSPAMVMSTLLANETRNNQNYIPCPVKYGWVDPGQTNIHTEAIPQNTSPKYGFFQLESVEGTDTALSIPGPAYFSFKPADIDYRLLEPFTSSLNMEAIRSVAIVRNLKTGALATYAGAYRQANGAGDTTSFFDEITLATLAQQDSVFIHDTVLTSDWVLEFAGVLVAVVDEPDTDAPSGNSKLMLAGYWYAGHPVADRAGLFARFRPDAAQFSSPTKDPTFMRIGDVPGGFLYRGNTLLWSSRRRPVP